MRLLHSRNSWLYREGSDPTVDFCLWVLHADGLQVPPFDQHPEGDGSLRALGLTALDWETWFLRVLDPAQRARDVEHLRQLHLAAYLTSTGEPDAEHLKRRYQAEQLHVSTDPAFQYVVKHINSCTQATEAALVTATPPRSPATHRTHALV